MRNLLATAISATVVAHAGAAPPSAESVETLLAVTKTETMLDAMYASMEQLMRQSMQQTTGGKPRSPQQQRVMDTVPARFSALMRAEMTWEKLKPGYVQLYSETFDQEEIDGLVAFYRSPAGQAFVAKMPTVMQKSVVLGQSQMQTLLPRMKAIIEQASVEAREAK
jgi:uncharacterized protein